MKAMTKKRKRVLVMKAMMKTRRKRAHLVLTKKKRRKKSLLVLTARIPVLPIVLAQRVTAIATPILTPTQKKNLLRNVKLKNPRKKSLLQSRNPNQLLALKNQLRYLLVDYHGTLMMLG